MDRVSYSIALTSDQASAPPLPHCGAGMSGEAVIVGGGPATAHFVANSRPAFARAPRRSAPPALALSLWQRALLKISSNLAGVKRPSVSIVPVSEPCLVRCARARKMGKKGDGSHDVPVGYENAEWMTNMLPTLRNQSMPILRKPTERCSVC